MRRYRRYDDKPKKSYITNFEKLTIEELKKVLKSLYNYREKQKLFWKEEVDTKNQNKKIEDENTIIEKNYDEKCNQIQLNIDKHRNERSILNHKLKQYSVGITSIFRETLDCAGYKIPIEYSFLVDSYKFHDKKCSTLSSELSNYRRELYRNKKPLIPKPRFKYNDPTLTISGNRLFLDIKNTDITEIDTILNQKIQLEYKQNQEKLDELNRLKERAQIEESKVRAQAEKYKNLESQLTVINKCPYCGRTLNKDNAHHDHIYPVSKGGKSFSNNLVYICSDCNLKKGNLTLTKFLKKMGYDSTFVFNNLDKLDKDY